MSHITYLKFSKLCWQHAWNQMFVIQFTGSDSILCQVDVFTEKEKKLVEFLVLVGTPRLHCFWLLYYNSKKVYHLHFQLNTHTHTRTLSFIIAQLCNPEKLSGNMKGYRLVPVCVNHLTPHNTLAPGMSPEEGSTLFWRHQRQSIISLCLNKKVLCS